jgi:hypothetical protein
MTTQFRYSQMYRFYRGFGSPTDAVFVRSYTANYNAIRYAKENGINAGQVRVFLEHSMLVRVVDEDDPLSDEYGTFVVFKAGEDKCQRLYVVKPVEHQNATFGTFWTADHFTFHANNGGGIPASKKLQLHLTTYLPDRDNDSRGWTAHKKSHLPLCFDMPDDVAGFRSMIDDRIHNAVPVIHEIMTRPLGAPGPSAPQEGGARRPGRRGRPGNFDELWTTLPIHRLDVIGIPNGNGYDITVFVTARNGSGLSHALFFRKRTTDGDLRNAIADKFKHFCWDDFSDV